MSEQFETSKDVAWLKELYFSDKTKQLVIGKGETLITEGNFNDRLFLTGFSPRLPPRFLPTK